MDNNNLNAVKHDIDRDEYFTLLDDVETEVAHYKDQLRGKVIYCPCDDEKSAFYKYFVAQFDVIGLKGLIATHYNRDGSPSYRIDYNGVEKKIIPLQGDGDYASDECMAILRNEADVIITNPPFSKSKEIVPMLANSGKKFLVMGNMNSLTFKEIFPLFKDNKIWAGYAFNKTMYYRMPDSRTRYDEKKTAQMNDGYKYGKVPAVCWFTNLDVSKRHEDLILYEHYTPEKYSHYDNYDAIEVGAVNTMMKNGKVIYGIPMDYDGVMGVPISYLGVHNPEQFEIVGLDRYTVPKEFLVGGRVAISGRPTYARILIRKSGEH